MIGMLGELLFVNDFEGNGRCLIEAQSWNFPGRTEENYEESQNSRCPDRNSNQAPSE
jgi:hypothetical protein